jgi:hypothetical protein
MSEQPIRRVDCGDFLISLPAQGQSSTDPPDKQTLQPNHGAYALSDYIRLQIGPVQRRLLIFQVEVRCKPSGPCEIRTRD